MSKNIYISGISDFFTKTIETSFYVRNITEKQTSESKKRYLEVLLQDSTGTIFGTILLSRITGNLQKPYAGPEKRRIFSNTPSDPGERP